MDDEIKAMAAVVDALKPLEPDTAARVLSWAAERYNVQIGRQFRAPQGAARTGGSAEPSTIQPESFTSFHELFDAANPTTGPDKALVTAYWFQVLQGQEDLDSQQLNTELKNLGHPSTNITRDLDSLIKRSPRFVMQVRKEGSTRQARKKYKVTREGIKAVERMLRGQAHADVGSE